jgi:uncharacterized protein YifE (UPF0438 family)
MEAHSFFVIPMETIKSSKRYFGTINFPLGTINQKPFSCKEERLFLCLCDSRKEP